MLKIESVISNKKVRLFHVTKSHFMYIVFSKKELIFEKVQIKKICILPKNIENYKIPISHKSSLILGAIQK